MHLSAALRSSTGVRLAEDGGTRASGLLRELRLAARNLIDVWPAAVYRERSVEARVLGRETLFVCDPTLIKALLVDHADALTREDYVLRALTAALGRGILTSDGRVWRRQRQTTAPTFQHDRIAAFVPTMQAAAVATRERWLARDADHPLDLFSEMMRTTFEIMAATMLSQPPSLDVAQFGQDLDCYLEQAPWKIALALLGAPSGCPHPGWIRSSRAARRMRRSVARIIAHRRQSGDPANDLLDSLLRARDADTGLPLSDASIIDNLLTFLAAGHETSALTLAWTFQLLAEHPEIETRLVAEAEAASSGGDLDLARLVFARQVLQEAMRLYPAAPLIARRTTREIDLDGQRIPAGQSIQIPVYAVHRHRALWAQPERFDPGRFAPEEASRRERYAYLPFGAGQRVCIGASFAMTECLVLLATLLPAVRVTPVGHRRPEARFKVTLRPEGGIPLLVSPRRSARP